MKCYKDIYLRMLVSSFIQNNSRNAMGALAVLNAPAKPLDTYEYPINLLEPNSPFQFCIVFNINVQDSNGGDGTSTFGKNNRAFGGFENNLTDDRGTPRAIVNAIGGGILGTFGIENISLKRKIKRITKTIRLYVPTQTMIFNQNNMYSDLSITQQLGLAFAGYQGLENLGGDWKNLGPSVIDAILSAYGKGIDKNLILYSATGKVLNPQISVIFQQTNLRDFQFDFVLVPRSKEEANSCEKIIEAFRKHMAPRHTGDETNGRFLYPPDEFDISFEFTKTGSYDKVPKISTCVLSNFNVDYSPAGPFSTFRDGVPTQILISMQLKEVELITQDLVDKGY